MARWLVIAAAVLVPLAFASGCKGACRSLSEKLCECEPNTLEKERCLQDVQQAEDQHEPTPEDEAVCESLYDQCDCELLDDQDPEVRAEAQKQCGMARPDA